MKLSPIVILTYTRLEHLKTTVEALQQNNLAQESVIYFFSDAPKKGDEKKVKKLRTYLKTITGFKKINIIERKENNYKANTTGSVEEILDKYGRAIVLEDDIVTAPGFLKFMNESLDIYEDRDDILSICGYTPSISINTDYQYDSFIFQKFIGWGAGWWKEKLYLVKPIEEKKYISLINNQSKVDYIVKNCGKDSLKNFEDECYSTNNHSDIQASFLECVEGMYTVYPKQSLVQNIGHDGSGLHNGMTDKFRIALWDKTENFILDKNIKSNVNIKKDMATFFSRNENDVDQSIIDTIVNKIYESNLTSFSIWGTNILTDLVLKELKNSNILINHIICSWAKDDTYYKKQKVITPQEALDKGEKNFIIMSFSSRFKMRDSIVEMTDEDIKIIMY